MIKATFDHSRWCITVDGHAGGEINGQGHDLVCCAASTLMEAFLYTASKHGYMMDHEASDGYMQVGITRGQTQLTTELVALFRFVQDGLQMLAEAYPDCICIEWIW